MSLMAKLCTAEPTPNNAATTTTATTTTLTSLPSHDTSFLVIRAAETPSLAPASAPAPASATAVAGTSAVPPPPPPPATDAAAALEAWDCATCTYMNAAGAPVCEMCGSVNPALGGAGGEGPGMEALGLGNLAGLMGQEGGDDPTGISGLSSMLTGLMQGGMGEMMQGMDPGDLPPGVEQPNPEEMAAMQAQLGALMGQLQGLQQGGTNMVTAPGAMDSWTCSCGEPHVRMVMPHCHMCGDDAPPVADGGGGGGGGGDGAPPPTPPQCQQQ